MKTPISLSPFPAQHTQTIEISKHPSPSPLPSPPRRGRLAADLKRLELLAFSRVSNCKEFVERFHALPKGARKHADFGLLRKLYSWMFVPLSLWPVDVKGLGLHVLGCVAEGRALDEEARLMCGLLADAPPDFVCSVVAAHEHAVKAGNYESLIESQHKFNSMEQELAENAELKADWERIKRQFPVGTYQNAIGVIRRRMVQERNFRPVDWKFAWETKSKRFQNVFDAFCHRWDLYGMEGDNPLLLKLTVNVTPYATNIVIPRYWSFDPKRDPKWKAIKELHRARSERRQGAKLSTNKAAQRNEAERANGFWDEATQQGLKGEERIGWVMEKMGWDPRTDSSRLKRLVK